MDTDTDQGVMTRATLPCIFVLMVYLLNVKHGDISDVLSDV